MIVGTAISRVAGAYSFVTMDQTWTLTSGKECSACNCTDYCYNFQQSNGKKDSTTVQVSVTDNPQPYIGYDVTDKICLDTNNATDNA